MGNKIPFYRFNGKQCDCSGDYLEEMSNITFDDIKSLSSKELNSVPISWICDWAYVTGHIRNPQVQLFINKIYNSKHKRHFRLLKKQTQIQFVGIKNEMLNFVLNNKKNDNIKCEVCENVCYTESNAYLLSAKQLARLQKVYDNFAMAYNRAKNGEEGFVSFKTDAKTTYLRRLPSFEYQFIIEQNGEVLTKTCTLLNYFKSESYDPLLEIKDDYFIRELKFYRGKATKDEVEYLNRMDGRNRILLEDKIYGLNDVLIMSVRLLPKSFFHCIDEYDIKLIIDGREHSAVYLSGNLLNINGYNSQANVIVTNELIESIQKKSRK